MHEGDNIMLRREKRSWVEDLNRHSNLGGKQVNGRNKRCR